MPWKDQGKYRFLNDGEKGYERMFDLELEYNPFWKFSSLIVLLIMFVL
jgi:hypothetical protein